MFKGWRIEVKSPVKICAWLCAGSRKKIGTGIATYSRNNAEYCATVNSPKAPSKSPPKGETC